MLLVNRALRALNTGAPEVMGCQFLDSCNLGSLPDDPPHKLFADAWAPYGSGPAHPPEDRSFRDRSGDKPSIESDLDPARNRHGADVPPLPIEVDNGLVSVSLL
jgi:hypothetical protein